MRQDTRAPSPASSSETRAPGAQAGDPASEAGWSWFSGAPATVQPSRNASSGRQPADDATLIQHTLETVGPAAGKMVSYFYAVLFIRHPELRDLFPAAMEQQRDRLLQALLTAAGHVEDEEFLTDFLDHLGRGHRKYGTRPEYYPAVGEALMAALSEHAGQEWTQQVEDAWVRAYTKISQVMIDAAAADELTSPAWWNAEIVGHETLAGGVAVLTVRPGEPYPYRAGQYASLETPWWPRVWRSYSFASAPREDGLLTFHVKAVPSGWVSTALVRRARPGDVIRLGPPAGSMTVDHTAPDDLLFLGGGTGVAPVKALVEEIAERGGMRRVEVFYGARHERELYDLDALLRLAQRHPWLSVRPVVSDGPSKGITGSLPDAVREYGPWQGCEAYLSGPPAMVREGLAVLRDQGIPAARMHHDYTRDQILAE